MLNTFTNTRTWMVASLLAAASIFGESGMLAANTNAQKAPEPRPNCDQKPVCPPKPCCPERPEMKLNCAYNAPARVEVDSCSCWDFYFGASFIYWEAMQDNMEFAATTSTGGLYDFFSTLVAGDITTSEIVGHDFTYKPGFKVMAGMNFDRDHWDGYAEYTWFKTTTTTSVSAGPDTATSRVGVVPVRGNAFMLTTAAPNPGVPPSTSAFNTASQEWKLDFQAVDAAIARTYYVGTKLTFRTIMGARLAWFSQHLGDTFKSDGTLEQSNGHIGTYSEKQSFSSWGAGLMAGLNTKWMLGEGFSMVGNGSFDLLYTRVQTTNTKFSYSNAGAAPAVYAFPDDRPDFVMPHTSLEFGFAWGDYFDCYKWHVDFAATYSFQAFWDANLFRNFDGAQAAFSQRGTGNLYMHGLNLSARVDF